MGQRGHSVLALSAHASWQAGGDPRGDEPSTNRVLGHSPCRGLPPAGPWSLQPRPPVDQGQEHGGGHPSFVSSALDSPAPSPSTGLRTRTPKSGEKKKEGALRILQLLAGRSVFWIYRTVSRCGPTCMSHLPSGGARCVVVGGGRMSDLKPLSLYPSR